jgi:excisionase family DNA binding protein
MASDQPDYYTVEEVARLLRLSEDGVRRMLREGRLPGIRLSERGRAGWRVPRAELERWLDAHRPGHQGVSHE